MKYLHERKLSAKAEDLIQFDADSIRQVARAERLPEPDAWLADPDAYEKNGRLLRDSESPRMVAYSKQSQTLYATDGCNSCARKTPLPQLSADELHEFARANELRLELLESLLSILRN